MICLHFTDLYGYFILVVSAPATQPEQLSQMDFHSSVFYFYTEIICSVVFGAIGGVLVMMGLKVWEARGQKETSEEVNENSEQTGSNERVFQQLTGKQPQEHDDDPCRECKCRIFFDFFQAATY